MNLLQTLFAYLFALGILIVFHELGHYFVARLCNVKVLRFSLGMGKVLYSRRFGPDQTEWVISAVPLGGYVKMLDVRELENKTLSAADIGREFTNQSVWKRIAIVIAGPMANFVLAILLLTVLFMVGVPEPVAKLRQPPQTTLAWQVGLRGNDRITAVNEKPIQVWSELRWELLQSAVDKKSATLSVLQDGTTVPVHIVLPLAQLTDQEVETDFLNKLGLDPGLSKAQLGNISPDGPAMRAGLQSGDVVLAINGKTIFDGLDLIEIVQSSPAKSLNFQVSRAATVLEFFVTPDIEKTASGIVGKIKVEVISRPEMSTHQDNLPEALLDAAQRTWSTTILTLKMVGKLIAGEVSVKNITGPLTIADYAGQAAKIGWMSYLNLLAFISISLGVMNLLPIPVLDGGHLLYYSLEVLTGRPVSTRIWEMSQRAGVAVLLLLMMIAFYNDIVRLLPT